MDVKKIVENVKRQQRVERERIRTRVEEARREVLRLKEDFLSSDPGLAKMVLFGSLAEDRVNATDFDIDLAVDCRHYLRLLAIALSSPFRVDLIDLNNVRENIKQEIDCYGKVVYEKSQG